VPSYLVDLSCNYVISQLANLLGTDVEVYTSQQDD
jgi:hypothetical protein